MPVAIRNLTSRPLFVSLNSGTDLRLSAGEVAGEVPDVELKDNAKIDKLIAQRAIEIETQAAEEAPEAAPAKPAAREKRAAAANPSDSTVRNDSAPPSPSS